MKATSIEDIREHLAKGGRVQRLGLTVDVIELDGAVMSFSDPLNRFCQVALHDEEVPRWELLPFEELPHDQGHICNELPDEDSLPGIDASTLPILKDEPAKWKYMIVESQHRHIEQLQSVIMQMACPVRKQNRRSDIHPNAWLKLVCEAIDANESGDAEDIVDRLEVRLDARMVELRQKVLHGYTWTPEEQREVWQWLTGEKIEPGKRCEACGGDGKRVHGTRQVNCTACLEHPGYERQPTWMEAK